MLTVSVAGDTTPTSVELALPDGLAPADRELVRCVARHLELLADLTHADVSLFTRSGEDLILVASAQPVPVPSLYAALPQPRVVPREEAAVVHHVLFGGQSRNHVGSAVVRGAPVIHEVFPIHNERGVAVAALRSEMLLIEHERQRKRNGAFRRAIARARDLMVAGRMRGGECIGRLGVHDGIMVVDASGRIEYMSAPAEYLYRRLGYADTLVKTQLQELETNEYICFKSMERGVCLEQRVQEGDLVWSKRVIPLLPGDAGGWASKLGLGWGSEAGAIVAIADMTDELRKEQELKIKTAVIQEIHHRVKNNLQTIAALLRLQARRSDSPELGAQLRETVGRILSVAVVHEFLSLDDASTINIHEVANRILGEVRHGLLDPTRNVVLSLEGLRSLLLPAQQATSCALIINELVQNAVEHAFVGLERGKIVVRLLECDYSYSIEIEDDGKGLPASVSALDSSGLGLQIVRRLAQEDLKGELEFTGERGLKAIVSFPKWIAESG